MNANDYWSMFMKTGAPEIYLMFNKARKMESNYVYNDSRPGIAGHTLQ